MKAIFEIPVLLVAIFAIADVLGTESNLEKSVNRRKRNPPQELISFNQRRKQFAQDAQIEPLPELVWDTELEEIAKKMPKDCGQWNHGSNYRVQPEHGPFVEYYDKLLKVSPRYNDLDNANDTQKAALKKFDDYINAYADKLVMLGMEEYNRKQTKMACVVVQQPTACTATASPRMQKVLELYQWNFKELPFDMTCVFGPVNSWDPEIRKHMTLKGKVDDLDRTAALAEALMADLADGSPMFPMKLLAPPPPSSGLPSESHPSSKQAGPESAESSGPNAQSGSPTTAKPNSASGFQFTFLVLVMICHIVAFL